MFLLHQLVVTLPFLISDQVNPNITQETFLNRQIERVPNGAVAYTHVLTNQKALNCAGKKSSIT
ncbi:hypothetical protein N8592_00880 [Verrucomicrobia bacterium]|nr:hypothetical protein [Verrucomicrobiota bacterium]